MRTALGAIVLVGGVAGLAFWGANQHAGNMEAKVTAGAAALGESFTHPLEITVSGRDITVAGLADTEAELADLRAQLMATPGRRVVNLGGVEVLPFADPFETALAKGPDGSIALSGNAPSLEAALALEAAGVEGASSLPLAAGALGGWSDALTLGRAALDPLIEGSFALTGPTAILSGKAQTSTDAEAAATFLAQLPDGYDKVAAIDVIDPGVVAFELRFGAAEGLYGTGTIPAELGAGGIASALGLASVEGTMTETIGTMDGLDAKLAALAPILRDLNALNIRAQDGRLTVEAYPLPGLDADLIRARLLEALGGEAEVAIGMAPAPEDGATRVNLLTEMTEVARAGYWLPTPDFEVSKAACNGAVSEVMGDRRVQFVTGSAALDAVSMAVINDLAGLLVHCTQPVGMRVIIGGHTDAQGDDNANYRLSVERAQAVMEALLARGLDPRKMQAIGYGETEPVADNDTLEGRAQNRRTTFTWPE